MSPTISQQLVNAADSSAGKYFATGLYKNGLIIIEIKIKKPINI